MSKLNRVAGRAGTRGLPDFCLAQQNILGDANQAKSTSHRLL